ncbi:tartrate dehydrogenase [Gordonia sp. HNM0687]|uniref:D-malate dehydrogenase (decarboxylating) n=1 Tax=Gordonia mangrovi TaxID=2665643 RepID=A0A6L7GQZ8_9ACTN|nr:tartrate dehydrogenase [Gordonia mangrovi]MXP21777.1 tartrate dehydrogenase [Gordonia mangrovi]UVF80503.1 tartrate dehydrogenase [Gordonia mangrovi]
MTRVGYRIALIPGDGIGAEVVPPAAAVLQAIGHRHGITFDFDEFDWSCQRYVHEGAMMPTDGIDTIRGHDAILLGAVGWQGVPDSISLWGLLIPLRRAFHQYVNLRPIMVFDGVRSPLTAAKDATRVDGVDFVIVRENVEGEYSEIGGRMNRGLASEQAIQTAVFTRPGISRVAEYAFGLAAGRRGRVTSATKSNGIVHTMPFWDEVVSEVAEDHPGVALRSEHIDALAAKIVLEPAAFDVIVASNLFGDVLSDLAAAVAGSIGIAPSGNLNPEREFPSMFEPVHGSAPDIAGRDLANPVGAIWSAAMMLEHLGHREAATEILDAVRALFVDGIRTRDIGGSAGTAEFTRELLKRID